MKALVVVDYQNDHVVGPMSNRYTQLIEGNICKRIDETLESGGKLFFLIKTFNDNYLRTAEGKRIPIMHCIMGTPGAELYGRMNDYRSKGRLIRKSTHGSDELMSLLRSFDEIELCGVETETDVLANAIIARTANPEAKVIIRQNCVASRNSDLAEEALDVLAGIGVEVI